MKLSSVETLLAEYINNEAGGNWFHYTPNGIRLLLERAGNPQQSLRSIHIAGTNGKGSTAHMLEKIFRTAGYSTGLYTSPHLLRYNERIRINGDEISDQDMLTILSFLKSLSEKETALVLTLFDVMTAAALYSFHIKNVDIAIIETGLGGRLDSTNIITPLCSIITSISYDHTAILGTKLEDIAAEKAGIIKDRVPVVAASCSSEVLSVLKKHASSHSSLFLICGTDFEVETIPSSNHLLTYRSHVRELSESFDNIHFPLQGDFQRENLSLALTASLLLQESYPQINTDQLCNSLSDIYIPGRMEIISNNPLVIFDPAHNPAAIQNLLKYLSTYYSDKKLMIVLSLMADKDCDHIVDLFSHYGARIIFFQLNDPRALTVENVLDKKYPVTGISRSEKELSKNLLNFDWDMLVYTGTFRLYRLAKTLNARCE